MKYIEIYVSKYINTVPLQMPKNESKPFIKKKIKY